MKLFTGWVVSAGLVLAASAANAQMLAPNGIGRSHYSAVSDFDGPYAGMPPEVPAPRYAPALLPPQEVYAVLRESGFSPLGIPHQRGFVYVIAAIDRDGQDGRLIIDARNGQIIRFVPAYRMGGHFDEERMPPYGAAGPLAPMTARGVPRPPASIPRVASRTAPVPKASPLARPAEPSRQSAAVEAKPPAVEAKPAEAQPAPQTAAAPTVGAGKPAAPVIQPTQEMPKVQGLE
jgi:hypothetical protein